MLKISVFAVILFCSQMNFGGQKTVISYNGSGDSVTSVYITTPTFYWELRVLSPYIESAAFAEVSWVNQSGEWKHPHLYCGGANCYKTMSAGPRNGNVEVFLIASTGGKSVPWPEMASEAMAKVTW